MAINGNFQFRRGLASLWTSSNPTLLSGELGLEEDTDKFKIGDGTTAWNMLPYGGIKGDQGIQGVGIASIARTSGNGAAGTTDTYTITYTDASTSTFTVKNGSSVIVGATTVVTPAVGPSVSDADAGENVDLRFNLPRARNVSAGTTNTITPVTNPSVSSGTNGDGDVSLTFNLPRARAVSAGTTTTGNAGTNASVSSANDANGDVTLNFTIPRGDIGETGPAANAFTNIAVTGQNTVVAEQANDTLTLVAGTNISITTNDTTDSIVINSTSVATNGFGIVTGNSGTATADTPNDTLAITGGTGISTSATDTPDGFVITNTGVLSVNGQTGAVTVAAGTDNTAVTRTSPTASASTALTTIQSFPITGGSIVAGSEFEFSASLRVINTTTATNAVVTVSVGAVNIVVLTQALGTTAAAAPGAPVSLTGVITFTSPTQAECVVHLVKSQAVAANAIINTSAPITVVTATNTTLDLKFNTSGATSTFICRQATIQRVK